MAVLILDTVNEADLLLEVKWDIVVHHGDTAVKSACAPSNSFNPYETKIDGNKRKIKVNS